MSNLNKATMFKLSTIKPNDKNPRTISPTRFEDLKRNVEALPKILELRPIVYDPKTKKIVGGNMRYEALLALGYTEVPNNWVRSAKDFTVEELRRFIILDNTEFGVYNHEMLFSEFTFEELSEAGLAPSEFKYMPTNDPGEGDSGADLPDVDIKGNVNNLSRYLILEIPGMELGEKVRAALGMKPTMRVITWTEMIRNIDELKKLNDGDSNPELQESKGGK